jgi:hypothetical protein
MVAMAYHPPGQWAVGQLIMPIYRQASFEASAGQFAGKTDLRRVSPELGARYT